MIKNSIITIATDSTAGSFAIIAGSFIRETLSHMIPWLIASLAVIVCDLISGIRKSILMNERVHFSSAIRRTMGKMVTYFAFVCMAVTVDIASGGVYHIDIYSCLLVCFIEFCSVLSNILKPKGYNIDLPKLLALLFGKLAKTSKEEIVEIVKEEGKNVE